MAPEVLLPSGQRVILAPDLGSVLHCGVLVVEAVRIAEPPEALRTEIENCASRLRTEFSCRQPADIPTLQNARRLYRSVGMDPTRHRPSSEALLRRVLKGHSLYVISNAVDACNLASLSFLLPIGMYDLAHVEGDVIIRLGNPGEEYPGIRKGQVHLQGRLGLFDRTGPFGSPTSDSARTCVTPDTRDLLAVILADVACSTSVMTRNLELLADLLVRHCCGTVSCQELLGWEDSSC